MLLNRPAAYIASPFVTVIKIPNPHKERKRLLGQLQQPITRQAQIDYKRLHVAAHNKSAFLDDMAELFQRYRFRLRWNVLIGCQIHQIRLDPLVKPSTRSRPGILDHAIQKELHDDFLKRSVEVP